MLKIMRSFLPNFNFLSKETPYEQEIETLGQVENKIALEEIKTNAKMVCDTFTPEIFDCAITGEPPLTPVITPLGNIYEAAELEIALEKFKLCPLTQTPLALDQVQPHSFLTKTYQKLNAARKAVPKEIDACQNAEEVGLVVLAFQTEVLTRADKLEKFQKEYAKNRTIQAIKDQLRLDGNNKEHLVFWQKQCKLKMFGGGAKISLASDPKSNYSLPTGVHKMMLAASQDYKTVDDFIAALEKARNAPRKNFLSRLARSERSQQLYTAKNLRTFKL